jgi:membrane associated rhomboid family serine protease
MWGPWRAELLSETVLMFCNLCSGSGNICGCVFQLQLGAAAFGAFGACARYMTYCEVERGVLAAAKCET